MKLLFLVQAQISSVYFLVADLKKKVSAYFMNFFSDPKGPDKRTSSITLVFKPDRTVLVYKNQFLRLLEEFVNPTKSDYYLDRRPRRF